MNLFIVSFSICLLTICVTFAMAGKCSEDFGMCDKENGLCWQTGRDTHFCSCKAGYKEGSSSPDGSQNCIDVDECTEDTVCTDNAICKNTFGSYICECRCGYVMDYTGEHCLNPLEITDACEIPLHCEHKDAHRLFYIRGVPFSVEFSKDYVTSYLYRQPVYQKEGNANDRYFGCDCETGFTPNTCGYCVDFDECLYTRPCQGAETTCTNTEGSYYCGCNPGYVLGPCGRRCYRQEDDGIPIICEHQDLQGLAFQGVTARTDVSPVSLPNWRKCAPGVTIGQTTVERYDIDHDGVNDLKLTWLCSAARQKTVSVLKFATEEEARWGEWTCWSACKATCWGGLQTRVRNCMHGPPGLDGCKGEGSQKRECYTGKKCSFRIRKDASTLTTEEIDDLLQAMEKYKQDTSVKGFFNAAAAHGWPNQCDDRPCCPHGAKMTFLAWHRTIILNYEEGLTRYLKNKTLGLPYWNWLNHNRGPPEIGWNKTINGKPNPFTNMTVFIDREGPMRTIQRDDTVFTGPLNDAESTWRKLTKNLMSPGSMHEFAESLEGAHGGPHVSICGKGRRSRKCDVSLANLAYAGFDPLFMLHHCQVDRLWAVAQKNNSDDPTRTTWTLQTALEALEPHGYFGKRHMPFGNKTINAFPIVQAVNTMRDSYYYEELTGVKYDTLENDGYPPTGRFLRTGGLEVLFVGHYFQSVEVNIYVNYYIVLFGNPTCEQLSEELRVASTVLQGIKNEYRNSIARLMPMEKVGFKNLDVEYNVKACYTESEDCKSNCPESDAPRLEDMPDPLLVHYLPNQPIDVYKFNWATGRKLPGWLINLDAGSQWVFFYGDRTRNITQVTSGQEWYDCDSSKGVPIPCSLPDGSACLLPSGIYFLIDNDRYHCEAGLKLLIVARK